MALCYRRPTKSWAHAKRCEYDAPTRSAASSDEASSQQGRLSQASFQKMQWGSPVFFVSSGRVGGCLRDGDPCLGPLFPSFQTVGRRLGVQTSW